MPNYKALRDKDVTHPIEVVGARLRGMMPFLDPVQLPQPSTVVGAAFRRPTLAMNKYSSQITQPRSQGASQAMLYGTGLTTADMQKAQVGICSMWYEGNPCNMHLDRLGDRRQGRRRGRGPRRACASTPSA